MKQIIRTKLSRKYSTNFSFISNDVKHIFEVEKLSPEENLRAIPKRPPIPTNLKRFNHEVPNPKEIKDLFTKLNSNDVLISNLSKNKKMYADDDIKLVTGQGEVDNIYFPNSAILLNWIKEFNNQIIQLKPIEIEKRIISSIDSEELNSVIQSGNFDKTFNQFKIIKHSKNYKNGNMVEPNQIHVNKLSLFVLNQSDEMIELYLDYIMSKKFTQYFTFHGLKDFINQLVLKKNILNLDEFLLYINQESPQILNYLTTDSLDRVANIVKDVDISKKVLSQIIKRGYLPSESSINHHLKHYFNQNDHVILKQELSFLKPVFHLRSNDIIISILLKTVTNIPEFAKLILLLKAQNTPDIFDQYQLSLFKKLMLLKPTKLELAQFVNLLHERKIKLNEEILQILREKFPL